MVLVLLTCEVPYYQVPGDNLYTAFETVGSLSQFTRVHLVLQMEWLASKGSYAYLDNSITCGLTQEEHDFN